MDPGEAAELLGRFKREAQAAGRLNHPGIVSIHDYGEDDGLAFIAMEFIKGKELRNTLIASSASCSRISCASCATFSTRSTTRIATGLSTATSSPPTS